MTANPGVVSCGVLVMTPQRELLLGHAGGAAHWDIPKGVADAGEAPIEAALRETAEEAGLRLHAEQLVEVGRFAYRPRKALHLFAALVEGLDPAQLVCTSFFVDAHGRRRPEVDRFRRVPFDEVPRLCAASMTRVLTQSVDLDAVWQRLAQSRE